MEFVKHTILPIWNSNSRILILGSMPSPKSREAGFYYAHPQNRFWPALAALFHEPVPPEATGKTEFLLRHGIALWDVLKSCSITGADDASIKNPVANDIAALLSGASIRAVFTTGAKASALYRRLCFPATGIAAVPLPSPSPANCRYTLQDLTEAYHVILDFL